MTATMTLSNTDEQRKELKDNNNNVKRGVCTNTTF